MAAVLFLCTCRFVCVCVCVAGKKRVGEGKKPMLKQMVGSHTSPQGQFVVRETVERAAPRYDFLSQGDGRRCCIGNRLFLPPHRGSCHSCTPPAGDTDSIDGDGAEGGKEEHKKAEKEKEKKLH